MTRIHARRMTAKIDGEVVVFLIRMRISRLPALGPLESAGERLRDRATPAGA